MLLMNLLNNQKMKVKTKLSIKIWVKAGKYHLLKTFCKILEMKTFKFQIIRLQTQRQDFLRQEKLKKNKNR